MSDSKIKDTKLWLSVMIFLCILVFVLNPADYMQSITNGLTVWAVAVIPALFPFFVLSKLLVELNFFDRFGKYIAPITKKLFNAPAISGYIFIISVVSGYPIGAKLTQEYFKKGLLTQTQCKKIATFTSAGGPLFILGTVAGKFFGNRQMGVVLLVCNILSAIVCGLLFRNFYRDDTAAKTPLRTIPKDILNDSIYSSVIGILNVGAFICLFYMLTDMLFATNAVQLLTNLVIPQNADAAQAFVAGIFEITRGCRQLAGLNLTAAASTVLCGTLISFGGFCIILQSHAYLKDCGLTFLQLTGIKTVQAAVMSLITFAACMLIF